MLLIIMIRVQYAGDVAVTMSDIKKIAQDPPTVRYCGSDANDFGNSLDSNDSKDLAANSMEWVLDIKMSLVFVNI